uniref:Putative plant transposon protein domain-containing protein n=1 Tax=Cannabis sativa TaxID=3483 RepID=A0A803Q715_CANSA
MIVGDEDFGSIPPWLIENIKKRNWLQLCEDPASAVCQVVKEFYANFLAHELPAEITVREVKVKFSDRDINHYYLLKNVTFEFSKYVGKLIDELIDGRGVFRFKRTDLKQDIKCLYNFMQSTLLPTSHDSTVSRERMWMLYCIVKGKKINVGKVIAKEIFECAHRVKGKLFFSCLITEKCRCANVPMLNDEDPVPRKGVVSFEPDRAPKRTTPSTTTASTSRDPMDRSHQSKHEALLKNMCGNGYETPLEL